MGMDLSAFFGLSPAIKDGAMGTMLQQAGLPTGTNPEDWNVTHPDAVLSVHMSYADAGANLILSNTFGGNRMRARRSAFPVQQLVFEGVSLAKKAASGAKQPCYAALDIGPLGALLEPYGDLTESEAETYFLEAVQAGAKAGADCIVIETMSDLAEISAAIRASKSACSLPVFATMTFDARGRLFMGDDVPAVTKHLVSLGVDGLGCNCGLGPEQMLPIVSQMRALTDLPILACPNAGLPRYERGQTVYDVSPEQFADVMQQVYAAGASLVGGCCGTTPAHIRALADRLR